MKPIRLTEERLRRTMKLSFKQSIYARREAAYGRTEVVYFIAAKELGLVKIGKSSNLKQRFADLQLASPVPLEFIFSFETTLIGIERALHRHFAKYRKHGEWFELNKEILDWIESVRHHDISKYDIGFTHV